MKIMFVCTGNTCRSAMAKGMLEMKLKELGKKDKVESCGIFAYDGDPATEESIEAVEEYGVDLKKHKATNIKNSKIEKMDLILCATSEHKKAVLAIYPKLTEKIYTMKEYVGYTDSLDLADPWGYTMHTYRKCAQEIYFIIEKIVEII